MYPYQISFECGSAELSHVLAGFNQADHFFHVKWLSVEETGTTTSGGMLGFGNLWKQDTALRVEVWGPIPMLVWPIAMGGEEAVLLGGRWSSTRWDA